MNLFHLPISEMSVTLLDVYNILGIPIQGHLMHQAEVSNNNERQQLSPWLMGEQDHDWEHWVALFSNSFIFSTLEWHLKLYITSIIATYICMDKNSSSFPLGLMCVAHEIYT